MLLLELQFLQKGFPEQSVPLKGNIVSGVGKQITMTLATKLNSSQLPLADVGSAISIL